MPGLTHAHISITLTLTQRNPPLYPYYQLSRSLYYLFIPGPHRALQDSLWAMFSQLLLSYFNQILVFPLVSYHFPPIFECGHLGHTETILLLI